MAEKYGFFDAMMINGEADRVYSADDVNQIFSGILSNGVIRMYKNALKVTAGGDFTVNVDTGKAIVNEHWYINTAIKTLELTSGHATMSRYTSVVLRFSRSDRSVTLATIDGESSSDTPSIPELTQNDDIYEIRLANILIDAGATTITSDKITDEREYAGGIVDTPAINYRRYEHTVEGTFSQRFFDIPDSYNYTPNTILEVYVDGVLSPTSTYTIQINEVEGNYMVVFNNFIDLNKELSFVMIN